MAMKIGAGETLRMVPSGPPPPHPHLGPQRAQQQQLAQQSARPAPAVRQEPPAPQASKSSTPAAAQAKHETKPQTKSIDVRV